MRPMGPTHGDDGEPTDPADDLAPGVDDPDEDDDDLPAPGDPTSTVDGRSLRRQRNREHVLDAVLALFSEGLTYPTPDEVARRSGVSLRSVYRYFDDSETLLRAAIARQMTRVEPLIALDTDPQRPLADRIDALCGQRRRLYAEFAPVMRVATTRSAANPLIRERVEARRDEFRRQIADLFAPELAALAERGDPILSAIDALTSFEAVDLMYVHRGLDDTAVEEVMAEAIRSLLAPT